MKKFSFAILVLALVAPALVLFCHCCPTAKAPPSETSIQKTSCHCCEIIQVKRDHGRLNGIENLTTRFEKVLTSKALLNVQGFILPEGSPHVFAQERAGPVRFSSETPLYLSLQILRL